MSYSSLEFRPTNPTRPANWRWQLAAELTAQDMRRRRTDASMKRVKRFRHAVEHAHDDAAMIRIYEADPELYEAWAVYEDANNDVRWEVEARLMAQETPQTIEHKTNVPADSIELYHHYFFHVNDRLLAPSFLTNVIIGTSVHYGLAERAYDVLWKMYGYWGGPLILDAMIHHFNKPQKPDAPEKVTAFWKDDINNQLHQKAATAMRTMPINWQTQIEIMNLYYRMVEIERAAGEGAATESIHAGIKTMMRNLPWACVEPGQPEALNAAVADADRRGISLRATELMMIGDGRVPLGLSHLLETAKFPEKSDASSETN